MCVPQRGRPGGGAPDLLVFLLGLLTEVSLFSRTSSKAYDGEVNGFVIKSANLETDGLSVVMNILCAKNQQQK